MQAELVVLTTAPPQGLFLVKAEYGGRGERGERRGQGGRGERDGTRVTKARSWGGSCTATLHECGSATAAVSRSQADKSVVNVAHRQCLLEFLHASVRDLGGFKAQCSELVQPLEMF